MSTNYKSLVTELLKSIETGDAKPVGYINPEKYIQHNLAVGDGLAGFGAVLQALPKGSAKVNTVRVLHRTSIDCLLDRGRPIVCRHIGRASKYNRQC